MFVSRSLRFFGAVAAVVFAAALVLDGCAAESLERPKTAYVHVHKDFDVFEGTVGKEMTFNVEIHNMGEA